MIDPLLLALFGVAAGLVVALVDGRRAVGVAAVASSAGLCATAIAVGGAPAGLRLLLAALATLVALGLADTVAARWRWVAGLDPAVPLFSPRDALFGPRSGRLLAAVIALPVASWVSFNIPLGGIVGTEGLLFAPAYVWACGVARVVAARTVEDLAVGAVAIALAGATAWILRGGTAALDEAMVIAAIAPLTGCTVGWLAGRHRRRGEAAA